MLQYILDLICPVRTCKDWYRRRQIRKRVKQSELEAYLRTLEQVKF